MTKQELKNKLEKVLNRGLDAYDLYCDALNMCIEYDNESEGTEWFSERFDEIVDSELACEYIKRKIEECDDLMLIKHMLSIVKYNDDIYMIDAYGWVKNVEVEKIEWIINDIIEELAE